MNKCWWLGHKWVYDTRKKFIFKNLNNLEMFSHRVCSRCNIEEEIERVTKNFDSNTNEEIGKPEVIWVRIK